MAAISQKIGNLIGGVSQQPDTNKFNGQLRSCDNFYPDTALGLTKRPGLRGISKLANAVADGTWFPIFRDDQEKYIVQFSKAGALKIWSANNGIQQTVNAVAAESVTYATHKSADELQTLQINDFIFVLNRTKTVAAGTAASAPQVPFAFVTINTVAYSSTYTITLDNATNFSYATAHNQNNNHQLNVNDIVGNLVNSINANANYVAAAIGNTIFVRRANSGNFAISAVGGNAGTSITAFKGSVTSAAQLPKSFFNGWKIKVEGTTDSGADDYWVKFVTSDNTGAGAGFWEETIAPGVIQDLDATTMPHVIIREANGTFTYRQLDLASALGSTGPSTVAGIVTAVILSGVTSAGHVVGEQFAARGGTGNNLRLQVDRVTSSVSAFSTAANSSSYVREVRRVRSIGSIKVGTTKSTSVEYRWFLNGVQIGTTLNTNPLVIGNTAYSKNGAFTSVGNELRAGITGTTTINGIIAAVSIVQAGQGYTATNLVQNDAGDAFTITAVNTAPLEGDASRLNFWKYREIGDATTNPMPSFVGYPIDLISFYKNRIVFASRQNVVCSQAGDYFNFFASTVITLVDSDPIDISASTLKPIRLKHAISAPQGLLLFGDNAQMLLSTTTEAFSPKTAEINLLSTFSQTDRIAPVDIGSSYVFLEEGVKASSIYEMVVTDINTKPQSTELTRPLPTYIPAAIVDMQVSQSAGTMAILSKQETRSLYLYRWFNLTNDNRISGWFRWIMPSDVEFFTFDHDILFVVTKHGSNYVLSRASLLTDTPAESLLFEGQYLDVRLDLFDYNPLFTYDLATDVTSICFKDGFEDLNLQAVLVYLNADVAGYFQELTIEYDATKPVGQQYFLTREGNETAAGGICTVDRAAASTTATITTQFPHRLTTGNTITVLTGVVVGNYVVTVLTPTTFTITTVATTAIVFQKFVFSCVNTASKFALGYKYEASAQLPAFYVVKDERGGKDTLNVPRVSRIKVNSYNSGPYRAVVRSDGRDDFVLQLPQVNADNYQANNIPIIRNAQSTIPVMAKGDQFEFELIADSPFQTAFTSIDWEGTYNNKGISAI
jgi:hypothetical protein